MVQVSDLYTPKPGNSSPQSHRQYSLQRLAKYLPIALLVAFLLLLALLFGERLIPARLVQLESVVTQRSRATSQPSPTAQNQATLTFDGDPVFQASGWIESAPQLVRAVALNDGFVDTVHVLEGETVIKGQLLVELVSADAQLDLDSAKAAHAQQAAALSEKQAMIKATQAELQRLTEEVEIEHARLEELRDDQTRLSAAGGNSVPEQAITQSRLRVLTQLAMIKALEAKGGELNATLEARTAAVLSSRYKLQAAATDLARKQLALDRMKIRSSIDGIIQKLFVSPGMKRFAMMDDPESATIATLFKPSALQARIDVPLDEAAQLHIGQAVRLRSVFLRDKILKGRVSRIEGQADLQRNTLQVKVELLNPDAGLRPEMLCRAEFLAPRTGKRTTPNNDRISIYIPATAIINRDNNTAVWTLDRTGKRVNLQLVHLAPEGREGYLQVLEGLQPGAHVVVNPPADLQHGERIRRQNESAKKIKK